MRVVHVLPIGAEVLEVGKDLVRERFRVSPIGIEDLDDLGVVVAKAAWNIEPPGLGPAVYAEGVAAFGQEFVALRQELLVFVQFFEDLSRRESHGKALRWWLASSLPLSRV
jgi:hypothetical protein